MERKRPPAIRTLVSVCLALLLCGAAAAWLRLETGQPNESGDRRVAPERSVQEGVQTCRICPIWRAVAGGRSMLLRAKQEIPRA